MPYWFWHSWILLGFVNFQKKNYWHVYGNVDDGLKNGLGSTQTRVLYLSSILDQANAHLLFTNWKIICICYMDIHITQQTNYVLSIWVTYGII